MENKNFKKNEVVRTIYSDKLAKIIEKDFKKYGKNWYIVSYEINFQRDLLSANELIKINF